MLFLFSNEGTVPFADVSNKSFTNRIFSASRLARHWSSIGKNTG
jgi:hypothetical protein